MICPKCCKPYYFLTENKITSKCLHCSHEGNFEQPKYDSYHQSLYTEKYYQRTEQTDPQMKKIIRTLNIIKGEKVLDLGCGVGDYAKAFTFYSQNTIGLDLNIESAREKYPNIKFLDHDVNNSTSFENNYFDKIVSVNLIEHLENPEKFLCECRRILKKGGKICITTANLNFCLHDYFFDKTHLYEWNLRDFEIKCSKYFKPIISEKSSAMFNYYPANLILTKILKPDLLFIGEKT